MENNHNTVKLYKNTNVNEDFYGKFSFHLVENFFVGGN